MAVWVSEARKLISCHEIEDGERFVFSFESDFSAFILRLLEQSFRVKKKQERGRCGMHRPLFMHVRRIPVFRTQTHLPDRP